MLLVLPYILLAVLIGGGGYVYFRQRRTIRELHRSREKIQLEETRVFDFLHGLGEALSETSKPNELHNLIVEGALRILGAQGGALYLSDRLTGMLRLSFATRNCPPFFEVSAETRAQAGFTWPSYLRRTLVGPGLGLLGRAWKEGDSIFLADNDPRLEGMSGGAMEVKSAMVCALRYGEQNLGVLAIARDSTGDALQLSEFQIFQAIAEQSAFALYNAVVFSEVAEKKRLDEDLAMAHEIQRILLPADAPKIEGFEVAGINLPARQVSGDYYDYIPVDLTHCGVAIADVSGKGVPASLIMAMCRSVLRSRATGQNSPSSVLKVVNAQLFPDIKEDMFISMAYVILEQGNSTLTLSRAGHDAPLHYRASDGEVTKVKPPGMALGIDSGGVFNRITSDFSLTLETDDCLVLYTDGVTEALDAKGDEFGLAKVIESIQSSASTGAAGVIAKITESLRNFVGSQPQHDDITLIVIRKT